MKKLVTGMSAAALLATAALAYAQTPGNSKMAAADSTAAMFLKLDADSDGRVSAIEAANDSKVAAAFTAADADRDGYLSKAEFAQLGQSSTTDSAQPRSQSTSPDATAPSSDTASAPPQQ